MGTRILVLLFCVFLLVSCSEKSKYCYVLYSPKTSMCKGLVIGILNDNPNFFGWGRVLTNMLEVELVHAGYQIKDFSLTRNFFTTEEKILYFYKPEDVYSIEFLKRLGGLLDVEWIMGGKILEIKERRNYVKVKVLFWIRDTQNGKLIWLSYYEKDSNSYKGLFNTGKIITLGKLFDMLIKRDVIKDIKRVIRCQENL